jgi:hypothetical protein
MNFISCFQITLYILIKTLCHINIGHLIFSTLWYKVILHIYFCDIRNLTSSVLGFFCSGTCPPGFESPTWHRCSCFSRFIPGFNDTMLLVLGDVSLDSEASVVTSSISRFAGPTQFFGGAHRGSVSVRSCMWASASVTRSKKTSSVLGCNLCFNLVNMRKTILGHVWFLQLNFSPYHM